jgi:hypothetical protein
MRRPRFQGIFSGFSALLQDKRKSGRYSVISDGIHPWVPSPEGRESPAVGTPGPSVFLSRSPPNLQFRCHLSASKILPGVFVRAYGADFVAPGGGGIGIEA